MTKGEAYLAGANDLAIDTHAARGDELLGAAAGRDPAIGQHLLQPDHVADASRTGCSRTPPSGVSARGSSSRLESPKHSRNSHVVP